MTDARPNILIYISHDTGRHIGPYGIKTVQTPQADRFAAEGLVFEQGFCTAPQCSPARAALFTGRYPHANGVMGLTHAPFHWDLHRDEVHAARWFGDLGYRTAGIGIAHETSRKAEMGYHFLSNETRARHVGAVLDDWLGEGGDTASGPFFAAIGVFETHRPFRSNGAEADSSLGVQVPPYLADTAETRADLAEQQGMTRNWDAGLGDIMASLERRGLSDNTLVLVTSDHGIAFPRSKCTCYDAGIEVLTMMRWPAMIAAGRRSPHLISHVDLLPTLLSAAGATPSASLHGVSFLDVLRDPAAPPPRDRVFVEKTYHAYYDPMRGLRTARYKYIRNFEPFPGVEVPMDIMQGRSYPDNIKTAMTPLKHAPEELYDLSTDPLEYTNLAGKPELAEVKAEFASSLARWMRDTGDPLLTAPITSPVYARSRRDVQGAV